MFWGPYTVFPFGVRDRKGVEREEGPRDWGGGSSVIQQWGNTAGLELGTDIRMGRKKAGRRKSAVCSVGAGGAGNQGVDGYSDPPPMDDTSNWGDEMFRVDSELGSEPAECALLSKMVTSTVETNAPIHPQSVLTCHYRSSPGPVLTGSKRHLQCESDSIMIFYKSNWIIEASLL